MRKFKPLFKLNYYSIILVEYKKLNELSNLINDNYTPLHSEEFMFLLNQNHLSQELLKKYILELKNFLENNKKILIISENIIKNILEENKRTNFLKIILKKQKKIILLSEENLIKKEDLSEDLFKNKYIYLNNKYFNTEMNILNDIKDLSLIFNKIQNPYKIINQ